MFVKWYRKKLHNIILSNRNRVQTGIYRRTPMLQKILFFIEKGLKANTSKYYQWSSVSNK